jgi:hypothetical protein
MWFRAVFEISTWRTVISAKDLERIRGVRLLRAGVDRTAQAAGGGGAAGAGAARPFRPDGRGAGRGKGGRHKELILVAPEADGPAP